MISGSSMVKAGHFPHLGENFKNWFAAFSISLVLGRLPRPQKKKKNKSKDMGAIKMFLQAAGGKNKKLLKTTARGGKTGAGGRQQKQQCSSAGTGKTRENTLEVSSIGQASQK